MSKKKVAQAIEEATQSLSRIELLDSLTAEGVSDLIGIQRNTTSQYLNELVKEGTVIKIKSRPAYFYNKAVFRALFFEPRKDIYDGLEELESEFRKIQIACAPDPFDAFIGANSSLKPAIDQIKSSVYYPGTGLPFLLHGETGVGKSHLAKVTHDFCAAKGLIEKDAPFLELNCAQYFHNQELLSSILFGYKKGAFTGAEEDHVGLLEAADEGILFLDECHRLGPESQEKLFNFIDNQTFQRIGENNKTRQSKVRLIFATTEKIEESFLRTFLRRIPITINIPNLSQRSRQEVSEFIFTFFIRESRKLDTKLVITPWIMNRMLSMFYDDNVGELKNIVKLMCARAYSRHAGESSVIVNSDALESSLLSRFLSIQEIAAVESKEIIITPDSSVLDFISHNNSEENLIQDIFRIFDRVFDEFGKGKINKDYLIHQLSREANTVIELFVTHGNEEKETSFQFLTNTIKDLMNFLESNYFVKIKGNSIIALSSYLYQRNHFSMDFPILSKTVAEKVLSFAGKELLMETKLISVFLELIETKLDVRLCDEERILLTFYLKSLNLEIKQPDMHGVILAHGFSTASSIADVVNHFLDEHVFDAFDMPFNVPIEKVQDYLEHYIANNDCSKGLVVLVDMGSLMILPKKLADAISGPILVINNVTTQQALFVGEMLHKGTDIQLIGEKITSSMPMEFEIEFPVKEKQPMIITVCHTGLGAAQQLKDFLQSSLPEEVNYKVEAADYNYIKKYGTDNSLFKQYDVQAIVGTSDPEIEEVPFVSLEDLISGQGEERINEIFASVENEQIRKDINNNLVRNLSIERLVSAITILDVKRVISYIDEVIDELERRLKISLPNSKKAILYVHIAGLVERSIRNQEELEYHGETDDEQRRRLLPVIAQSFEPVESAYNIKISIYELNYLYDIVYDL